MINTFDRLVTYKAFKFELVDIHGVMLEFLEESEAAKFLTEIDRDDVPLWSNDGFELSLIEYDDIKDSVPTEVKMNIEKILSL